MRRFMVGKCMNYLCMVFDDGFLGVIFVYILLYDYMWDIKFIIVFIIRVNLRIKYMI